MSRSLIIILLTGVVANGRGSPVGALVDIYLVNKSNLYNNIFD